jgi:RNA polymerase sigma-70 factor (ECF subfamily)
MAVEDSMVQGGRAAEPAIAGPVAEDATDFAAVVSRFETPLLRYVGQLLKPTPHEAEDVVQEVFLRLHRQVSKKGWSSIRNMKTWVFRVAHNLTLDEIRKRGRERRVRDEAAQDGQKARTAKDEIGDELGDMVRREACTIAMSQLQTLSEEERQVILLRIIEGLSLREIGEITGLSTGNVDYRINKALRELTGRLKDAGVV